MPARPNKDEGLIGPCLAVGGMGGGSIMTLVGGRTILCTPGLSIHQHLPTTL